MKDKTKGMNENKAARKRAAPSCSLFSSRISIIPRNGMKIIRVRIGKFIKSLLLFICSVGPTQNSYC
jgi:hypothetical protein